MLGEAKRLASLMVLESLKIDALGVSWEAFLSFWELYKTTKWILCHYAFIS